MAGAGAKKRHDENRKHVSMLRVWLATGLLTFLAVKLLARGGYSSKLLWTGYICTSGVAYMCYSAIAALAAPTFGARGELLDGGADMNMKGLCSYYHDLFYVTIIVMVGASFVNWFWYVYLVVPGFGLWKLWELVVIPWWTSSGQEEPVIDEETRKRLERAEKRAQRRAQKWR